MNLGESPSTSCAENVHIIVNSRSSNQFKEYQKQALESAEHTDHLADQISTQPDYNNLPVTRHLTQNDLENYFQQRKIATNSSEKP